MKAQLNVLSGSISGSVHVFSKPEIAIGRHPKSDVQFNPEGDLQVSARHAVLRRDGEHWVVEDLSSSNGTLVNGHPIHSITRLADTDQIQLGVGGPRLEFRFVSETVADTIKPIAATRPPRPTSGSRGHTAERVQVEVARQTRRLRQGLIGAVFVALIVAAVASYVTISQNRARTREIARLQSQIEGLLASSDSIVTELQGQMMGLAEALERSQMDARELQQQLTDARSTGNNQRVASLSRRLTDLMTAMDRQQNAARIDHVRIREENNRAVALIYVQYASGEVVTGTAFAVRPDATLITNRHVVAGESGNERPTGIRVQFADSEQAFGGELVAVSEDPDVDLAVVRALLSGTVRTVKGLNARGDTIPEGAPVATIGFPQGTQLALRGIQGRFASTSLTAGIVSRSVPGELQVHGYGAEGASGSPIFDANGEVIGILYGGTGGQTTDRLIYAVPVRFAIEMLERIP